MTKEFSRCCPIVDLRYVLTLRNAENVLSQDAVVTGITRKVASASYIDACVSLRRSTCLNQSIRSGMVPETVLGSIH